MQEYNEYRKVISAIRRKRVTVIVCTVVLLLGTLALGLPFHLEILGETVMEYKGLHPVLTVVLLLVESFLALIAFAIASMPLTAALDTDYDPQKFLALHQVFTKPKRSPGIYAVGYFYAGNFRESLGYAIETVRRFSEKKQQKQLLNAGICLKAMCAFMLGDVELLRCTTGEFEATFPAGGERNSGFEAECRNDACMLQLLCAIADQDEGRIDLYRKQLELRGTSKATACFIHYVKGIAAFSLRDAQECVYHLKAAEEIGKKTVFAPLAESYLTKLQEQH